MFSGRALRTTTKIDVWWRNDWRGTAAWRRERETQACTCLFCWNGTRLYFWKREPEYLKAERESMIWQKGQSWLWAALLYYSNKAGWWIFSTHGSLGEGIQLGNSPIHELIGEVSRLSRETCTNNNLFWTKCCFGWACCGECDLEGLSSCCSVITRVNRLSEVLIMNRCCLLVA